MKKPDPVPTKSFEDDYDDEEDDNNNNQQTSSSFRIDSHDSNDWEETYRDEDEEDSHSSESYDDFNMEELSEVAAHGRKLQTMGIMMGDDFSDGDGRSQSCCAKYWCWLLLGSVVAITLMLAYEGAVQYQKEAFLLQGDGEDGDDFDAQLCAAYDADALQVVERTFRHVNDTSMFCQQDQLEHCNCKHPYLAAKPESHKTEWAEIATMNLAMVQKYTKHVYPDVVLLGDSITEHWNGLDLGYQPGSSWRSIKRVFDKLFVKANGGKVNGVALGIGGDRMGNLLYRIQNGEAPPSFSPKIWWILIGTNDLADQCNADTIVVGNFRIVEEIRKYHPGSVIVLNSLLPRNENPDDLLAARSWEIISEINLKLECFANSQKGVEFFNATDVFVSHKQGKIVVNDRYMKDPVHPNAEGSRLWGEAIVDRVLDIKSKMRHHGSKKPRNSHSHKWHGNNNKDHHDNHHDNKNHNN